MSAPRRRALASLVALLASSGCASGSEPAPPSPPAPAQVAAPQPARVELQIDEGVPLFLPPSAVRSERPLSDWIPAIHGGPERWAALRVKTAEGETHSFRPERMVRSGGELRLARLDDGALALIVIEAAEDAEDAPRQILSPLAAIEIETRTVDSRVDLVLTTPSGTRRIAPDELASLHDMQRRQGRPGVTLSRLLRRYGGELEAPYSMRVEAEAAADRWITSDQLDGAGGTWALYHDGRGWIQLGRFLDGSREERIARVRGLHLVEDVE